MYADESITKVKKQKKNPDYGKEILDADGNSTNFVQGFSKESYTCKKVQEYLNSIKSSTISFDKVIDEVIVKMNELHGSTTFQVQEPSFEKKGYLKCKQK